MSVAEYRTEIELSSEAKYWIVHMGPVLTLNGQPAPDWHRKLYAHSATHFPDEVSAQLFAANHQKTYPDREIWVEYPDEE